MQDKMNIEFDKQGDVKKMGGKKVAKVLRFKVFYDKKSKCPVVDERTRFLPLVDLDQQLPKCSKERHIEEREIVMIILDKGAK